jgi:hypothetical protein
MVDYSKGVANVGGSPTVMVTTTESVENPKSNDEKKGT